MRVDLSIDGIKEGTDVIEEVGSYSGTTLEGATLKAAAGGILHEWVQVRAGFKRDQSLCDFRSSGMPTIAKDQLFSEGSIQLMLARACKLLPRLCGLQRRGSSSVVGGRRLNSASRISVYWSLRHRRSVYWPEYRIDPGCVVEDSSTIGENCWFRPIPAYAGFENRESRSYSRRGSRWC